MTLKRTKWIQACLLGAGLLCPAAAHAGGWLSALYTDNCANIPKGAQPAPPGTYVNKVLQVQESLAEADDFVLYRHMWLKNGTELGPLGRYQLDLIAKRLPGVPFPVVIETSKNDALDEARRDVVLTLLGARGLADPSRVIVAFPTAEGLYGEEAFRVYNGLLFGRGYGGYGGFGGYGGVGAGGVGNIYGGPFGGGFGFGFFR